MAPGGGTGGVHTLISANSVIQSVEIVEKLPMARWPTIWPFVILYTVEAVTFFDPTVVWPKATYIIWNTYIDFMHSVLLPMTAFIQIFFSLLTVWQLGFTVALLYNRVSSEVPRKAAKASGDHSAIRKQEALLKGLQVVIRTHEHKGQGEILKLQTRTFLNPETALPELEVFFDFQHRKWTMDAEKGEFVKPLFPTRHSMKSYHSNQVAGILTEKAKQQAIDSFGKNEIFMDIPEFLTLLIDHAMAPFFVFQMFCVFLWCLDDYWMFSLFTGFMMVVMECTQVFQRRANMKQMRSMGEQPKTKVWCYRLKVWQQLDSQELLPLDVIMLPSNSPSPCDTVLIRGTAVCNEAMLTGESTPQLKESLALNDSTELNIEDHTRHLVFGGTNVLLSSGPVQEGNNNNNVSATSFPPPPSAAGDGAIAVVLRVGFETKQGKLVRTIIHSQGRVSENSAEAFYFIGFLLVFAIVAVGYLLNRGLNDPTRSRSKLLLHCIQVLTSVVPPELPMELTLAVNTSLLSLMKNRIFCTEPFRIPFAGKIDTCCFDKTGTLTTDEMLFSGVDLVDEQKLRTKLEAIPLDTEEVLVGCHSLVMIDSNLVNGGAAPQQPSNGPPMKDPNTPKELSGDAMEKAAVDTLNWSMVGDTMVREDVKPKETAGPKALPLAGGKDTSKAGLNRAGPRLKIRSRFPFVPALRRMSCVVTDQNGEKHVVVKGSPESLRPLLTHVPKNYDDTAIRYAKKGFRVIALARKEAPRDFANMTRESAESGLIFAGFAIFQCPLKADSVATIQNLMHGSHNCMIITGDAIDTAVAVAKDVGIFSRQVATEVYSNNSWEVLDEAEAEADEAGDDLLAQKKRKVAKKNNAPVKRQLCVNTELLSTDADFTAVVEKWGTEISVWSRCAPNQKEQIVAYLKKMGRTVLMAGDGTNDVGGLKQAHVGIAVLNCTMMAPTASGNGGKGGAPVVDPLANMAITPMPPPIAPDAPFGLRMKYEMQVAKHKAETQRKAKLTVMVAKQKEARANQNQKFLENTKEHITTDDSPKNPLEGLSLNTDDPMSLATSMFNDIDDTAGAPMVKLGDASIAAPFTCKSKNMSSVVDIVKQGRCTLVTTLQMYKILGINCLISAYSMSVLHSDGIKYGDKQLMISGMVGAACFLLLSRSKPLDLLSKERPITKVFHPYMIVSILGQFGIHFYSLASTVSLVMGSDKEKALEQAGTVDEIDFKPSLLNSLVFMMTTIMTMTTFAVNYRGRPFMTGLLENRGMMAAIAIVTFIIFYCALEVDPEVNEMLEFVPFPSENFRYSFVSILLCDIVGSFAVDRGSALVFVRN